MSTLNDLWFEYLRGEGYTGSINDMLQQALQDETGSTAKQLNDLWVMYLQGESYTGSLNDMLYEWLGDKGFTGSLDDRRKAALEAGDVFGFDLLSLFANGENGFWWEGIDITKVAQDTGGTTPVTATGQNIQYIEDLSGNGNHYSRSGQNPSWGGNTLGSGVNYDLVVAQSAGEYLPYPNLGIDGYFYVRVNGAAPMYGPARCDSSLFRYEGPKGLVAALFIDRQLTAQELTALNDRYSGYVGGAVNDYSSYFKRSPIYSVASPQPIVAPSPGAGSMFEFCTNITTAPEITAGGSWVNVFEGCTDLSDISALEGDVMSSAAVLNEMFRDCTSLDNDFSNVDLSSAILCDSTWRESGITSFNCTSLNPSANSFSYAWADCSDLVTFSLPAITSFADFDNAWQNCTSMTSFSAADLSTSQGFRVAWRGCSALVTFPSVSFDAANDFDFAWWQCTSLANFPANAFDNCQAIKFNNAFNSCALTETSVDNILVSLDTAGQSNGTLSLNGGTNSAPGTTGATALANLVSRGWTVTTN